MLSELRKAIPLFLLMLLAAQFMLGQYDSLVVGQSNGPNVQVGATMFWQQVNVPSNTPPNTGTDDFDINGDGTPDIRFRTEVYGVTVDSMFCSVITLNGAEVRSLSQPTYVDSLLQWQLLLATDNWVSSQSEPSGEIPLTKLHRGSIPGYLDIQSGDKFMGVRFPVQGQWYYAWIKYYAYGYSTHWGAAVIREYAWSGDPNVVGIEEEDIEPPFEVSPNPSNGVLHITPSTVMNGREVTLEVIDQHGRMLKKETISLPATHMDMNDLPSGMYYLRIKSQEEDRIMKWLRL